MVARRGRSRTALVLLSEAFAIGLGVFLSLWADEWRTNRNEAVEGYESLARVSANLSSDTGEFARLSALYVRSVDAVRALLMTDPAAPAAGAQMAALIPFAIEANLREPTGDEYEALKGSGRLGLISNPDLVSALARYYTRQEYAAELFRLDGDQSHAVAELMYPHVEFPRDVFTPELRPQSSTAGTPSFYPVPIADPSVVGLLHDRVFVNEMTYMGLLKQLLINVIVEMRTMADELLAMISEEAAR